MNDIFDNLLGSIRTTDDKDNCLYEVESAEEFIYETGSDIQDKLKDNLSDFVYETYIDYLKNSKGDFSNFKKDLENYLENLPELRLEIAKSLSKKSSDNISNWLRLNVNPKIVIDFVINPHHIGGAVVIYQGKYLDKTIKNYLDSFFSNPSEVIKTYINKS